VTGITLTLPLDDPSLADAIKAEVARQLAEHAAQASPWLRAAEAAEYLRCPLSRIRKLTMTRQLPVHRDGSRVLYRRDELDAFVQAGGATSC